jgi:hypothetical protein
MFRSLHLDGVGISLAHLRGAPVSPRLGISLPKSLAALQTPFSPRAPGPESAARLANRGIFYLTTTAAVNPRRRHSLNR